MYLKEEGREVMDLESRDSGIRTSGAILSTQ